MSELEEFELQVQGLKDKMNNQLDLTEDQKECFDGYFQDLLSDISYYKDKELTE